MDFKKWNFNLEDISQVMIGAFTLAVPISFSEEAWNLGASLPWMNIMMLFFVSLIFLSFFTYQSIFQSNIQYRVPAFIFRILLAYLLTLAVVALVLFSLDKLPLIDEPILSLKRLIVIAMPASMGAVVVDSFDKE